MRLKPIAISLFSGIDPNRASRIKALGNSVMPQIAYALAIEIRGLS